MACSLKSDATGKYDFTSQLDQAVTIKITATGNALFSAAQFNTVDLVIQNGDTVRFVVGAGANFLQLVVAVADPNETITILEDCGGGQSQVLAQYKSDPANPVTGYSIFGGTDDPGPHFTGTEKPGGRKK
jgi:hypothetical protein